MTTQTEINEQTPDATPVQEVASDQLVAPASAASAAPGESASPDVSESEDQPESAAIEPQGAASNTASSAAAGKQYVYAIGRLKVRFPDASMRAQFNKIAGAPAASYPDDATIYKVLSQTENQYLAVAMCWYLEIEGIATYLVMPLSASDIPRYVAALAPSSSHGSQDGGDGAPEQLDVLVGWHEPGDPKPTGMCDGLRLPVLHVAAYKNVEMSALVAQIAAAIDEANTAASVLLES